MENESLSGICKIIQTIQQIGISLNQYADAGKNVLKFVSRPEICPRCDSLNAFHSKGNYSRFVDTVEIYVVRFCCKICALDVSVLPDFAMPYRNGSVEVVDRYFSASNEERRTLGGHDSLRYYWKAWQQNWQTVLRMIGEMADCPRMAWMRLKERSKSIAAAQRKLVQRYSQALFKSYVVHVCQKE